MSETERSWLVQRLEKPHGPLFGGRVKDNPFNFGGGLKNGGLSDEAMDLMRDIFSFDYMGAAEFEWGAVPKALQSLAAADALKAFEMVIPFAKVEKSWRKEDIHPTGTATVFVICPGEMGDEVQDRIEGWAKGGEAAPSLKEPTRLAGVLRGDPYTDRLVGWLELDNGFMFFTDRPTYEATAALFGLQVTDEVSA